ncbi:MAG: ATP-dependent Clp protease ATP-binding subunit [Lachnospiraceae bacterium]|nr:ATP-dependent Clp protease ATP-binding subunit [Lachnospiraceae bacterium]
MIQSEKWQKDLAVYKDINTAFIIEGNVHDRQPWYSELEERYIPIPLLEYLNRYLVSMGYEIIVHYNVADGFYNKFNPKMVEDFYLSSGMTESEVRSIVKDRNKTQLEKNGGISELSVCEAVNIVRKAMQRSDSPKAVIIEYARAIALEPDHLTDSEVTNYTKLMLASLTPTVSQNLKGENLKNLLFLVAEKANDIPAWFYLNNPMVKVLTISMPSKQVRESVIDSRINAVNGVKELELGDRKKLVEEFALFTDGMSLTNIDGIITIMRQQGIPITKFRDALKLFRYGETESHWDKINRQKIQGVGRELESKVKGQSAAISVASSILSRACLGLSGLQGGSTSRPKGVMFLAGPTGTGKTELAKRISEFVFGDESFLTRFDMSEYGAPHSDQKLLGAPPGYVGYGAGGQLTNAIKEKPFCILLFDEIEKAHPTILDKFLQILEDGRLTDSSGETVYFSEALIIFTSNLGINRITAEGTIQAVASPDMSYDELKTSVLTEIENYFKYTINRPEILNRIGENIVVFDYIRTDVATEILDLKLGGIIHGLKESKGINLKIGTDFREHLVAMAMDNLDNGGRGIVNILETEVVNAIARIMLESDISSGSTLNMETWDGLAEKVVFSVT